MCPALIHFFASTSPMLPAPKIAIFMFHSFCTELKLHNIETGSRRIFFPLSIKKSLFSFLGRKKHLQMFLVFLPMLMLVAHVQRNRNHEHHYSYRDAHERRSSEQ